jgi:hypothetical protein
MSLFAAGVLVGIFIAPVLFAMATVFLQWAVEWWA